MSRERRITLLLLAVAFCLPTLGPLAGWMALVSALAVLLRTNARNPISPAPSSRQGITLVAAVALLLFPAIGIPEAGPGALGWMLGPCFLLAAPFALRLFCASFRGKA